MSDSDDLVSLDDAVSIGLKVVEMADRVRNVDKITPGARAKWGFELDDVQYDVIITVRRETA